MKKITVGLVSHLLEDYNLGCVALSISNIKIMDEVFENLGLEVHYVVLITESFSEAKLDSYTKNSYEYRYYPRFRQTMMNPNKLLKSTIIDDCDLIINLCGGDGYTDIYGVPRLMAESQLVYAASRKGIKVIYAPQTIGPFKKAISKKIARKTLSKVDTIFVRDSASLECCTNLGLEDHTLQVIDVAFALPYTQQKSDNGKFKVGLNVSGLLYNGGYDRKNYFNLSFDYKCFTESLIEKLVSMGDTEVHLIPHVNSNDNEIDDDYRVCRKLSEQYPETILAPFFTSPIDAKSYISGMDLFIGARMHSTIAAFSSGVPVIPIAYSRKFNGLYDTLQYPYYVDAKSGINVNEAISVFLEYLNNDNLDLAIKKGKKIYLSGLEKYKECLKNIVKDLALEKK